jgi:hypothetical protein
MMEVPVLVERLNTSGYRATSLGLDIASEAPTREAALDGLGQLLRDKFAAAEIVHLEIPAGSEDHPWKSLIGRWRDHPDLDEVEQNMRDYRLDEQGDRL